MEGIQQDNKITMELIIIGAGGHAAEIQDYVCFYNDLQVKGGNKYIIKGFLDDNPKSYSQYQFNAPFLGDIKSHKVDEKLSYLVGIASVKYRRPIIEMFKNKQAKFITFIHPSAFVSKSSEIGEGVVIAPNVNIGPNVKIGKFNLINSRASIGHDTSIGNFNFITPNVCFSGFTKIGDENMFGINSATIPNINVGSRNIISAGMILDKNVNDDTTVFHRYKEKVFIIK